MGSESLSHKFTAMDPTYHGDPNETEKSSHHSIFHTSGTHPTSVSNGPSSSAVKKHERKSNSKYSKLLRLHRRQLSHIGTTLNAIESLSKPNNDDQQQMLSSTRRQLNKLSERLENLRSTPSPQDHLYFDSLKHDIGQLINDVKSYKMNSNDLTSQNTIDYLVGIPLQVSDNDSNEGKTITYL